MSVSQAEVMLGHLAAEIADRSLRAGRRVPEISAEPDAPWGVFPCAGDDEWCVVTARGDADFAALCRVLGRPELAADASLAAASGRRAARARIDAAVQEFCGCQTPMAVAEALQAAGVPASPMLRVSELPDFPLYQARGFFRPSSHPLLAATFWLEKGPTQARHLPDPPARPAPVIGQHSREILTEWLGLAPAEIDALVAAKILDEAVSPVMEGA